MVPFARPRASTAPELRATHFITDHRSSRELSCAFGLSIASNRVTPQGLGAGSASATSSRGKRDLMNL